MGDGTNDRMKGMWNQLKGEARIQWAKLTDDDMLYIEGQRDKLVGRIQERYGIAKDEAARQVDEFERKYEKTP